MINLVAAIESNGGFTYDLRTDVLMIPGEATGYVIAIPGTERIVGSGAVSREAFAARFVDVVREFADMIDNGAYVGGWYSDDRDAYMIEISEIHNVDRDTAVAIGEARNQEGIFDLATGEFIATGGTGDAAA